MSRRVSRMAAATAALTVACCVASVMSRNLLLSAPAAAARTFRDATYYTHHTNTLKEEEEQEEVVGVEAGTGGGGGGGQATSSPLQLLVDDGNFVSKTEVDDPTKAQRLSQQRQRQEVDVDVEGDVEGLEWALREGGVWGSEDAEVTPRLFQGDMMVLNPELLPMNTRVAVKWEKFPERRWINATVPYSISKLYGSNEKEMILRALHTLDFLTCIKFVPWDSVMDDYLLIWPMKKPRGCWSYVGRKGGQQILSLQPPDSESKRCFYSLGKPIHELLHALGVFHEQARPDRDKYVEIITENIIPRYMGNFVKQSADNTTFPFRYDYRSVMHYGRSFFSFIRSKPTIVPKERGARIGQRIMLSQLDCLKLNDLYGCLDDPFEKEKYTAFCMFLGY